MRWKAKTCQLCAGQSHAMQRTRIQLEKTESTNNVGSQWLKSALPGEILTIWTPNQTRGRGQRGRTWEQAPGRDIAWTTAVKWPTDSRPKDPVAFNKNITARIREGIAKALVDSKADHSVEIKWPNDIMIRSAKGRWLKCAGILIENTWRGPTWDGVLIGVGVNVNSTHSYAKRRCALRDFTNSELPLASVEANLSQCVMEGIQNHSSIDGYFEHLIGREQIERYSFCGKAGMGIVKTVNINGALEMEWAAQGDAKQQLTIERSDLLAWDWLGGT
ncbi:MAG: hypothetical protein CL845_05030 [Crocinitomicaceae bacterium]|nr:hypothetical protein [Crocinitomicaceae bacterium]